MAHDRRAGLTSQRQVQHELLAGRLFPLQGELATVLQTGRLQAERPDVGERLPRSRLAVDQVPPIRSVGGTDQAGRLAQAVQRFENGHPVQLQGDGFRRARPEASSSDGRQPFRPAP